MIKGTITSQGTFADGRDICEIYISRSDSKMLPHEKGKKTSITLKIGNATYEGGVHETEDGTVWISSVLKKSSSIPTRLVDALRVNDMKKGDKVLLTNIKDHVYILSLQE
jgi:hypothetical protein